MVTLGLATLAYLTAPIGVRRQFLLVGVYVALTFVSELAGFIGGFIFGVNMNLVANIHSLLEGPLLLFFYRNQIKTSSTLLLSVAVLVLSVFGITNLTLIQGPLNPNSYLQVCNSLFIITATVVYFFSLAKELPTETLTRFPMFWINTSLLLGFSGKFIANVATDFILNTLHEENLQTWIATWTIHNVVGVISYAGLTWAFILARKVPNQDAAPT